MSEARGARQEIIPKRKTKETERKKKKKREKRNGHRISVDSLRLFLLSASCTSKPNNDLTRIRRAERRMHARSVALPPGVAGPGNSACHLPSPLPPLLVPYARCRDYEEHGIRRTPSSVSRDTFLSPAGTRAIGRPAGVGAPRGFTASRTVSTSAQGVGESRRVERLVAGDRARRG